MEHQHQPAAFLQRDVGSPAQQAGRVPQAMSDLLRIEQGATTMPIVRNDPEEMDAAMSSAGRPQAVMVHVNAGTANPDRLAVVTQERRQALVNVLCEAILSNGSGKGGR